MVMWVSDDPRKPFVVFLAVTVALWLNNSTVAIYKMSSCFFFLVMLTELCMGKVIRELGFALE